MPPLDKTDFPPLLPPGVHRVTWAGLRAMCVEKFQLSVTRPQLFGGLERVVRELLRGGVEGLLWVDGSFLTEKIDPNDVDLVLAVDADVLDNPSAGQRDALLWFKEDERHTGEHCDCYVRPVFPRGHPYHRAGEERRAYWERQFGHDRRGQAKGIAELVLREGTL